MVVFKDDDDSYRTWLIANPNGFVLNTERLPTARYLKFHCAACPHVKAGSDRNPTSTGYLKACSVDVGPLEDWARSTTGGGMLDPCRTSNRRELDADEPHAGA